MKVTIKIPKEAIGIHAARFASAFFDPRKEPEKYKEEYNRIYKRLKQKNYG